MMENKAIVPTKFYYDFGRDYTRCHDKRITARFGFTIGWVRDASLAFYAKKIIRVEHGKYHYSKNKFTTRRHIRKKEQKALLFQMMTSEDMTRYI